MDEITFTCDFSESTIRRIAALNATSAASSMRNIGMYVENQIIPYIPYDTGKLALSGKTNVTDGEVSIDWSDATEYAHYMWEGVIYTPNYAVFDANGNHIGWTSPSGEGVKARTARPFNRHPYTKILKDGRVIHIQGYHNPKSQPHWTTYVRQNPERWYPIRFNIGRYAYEKYCEEMGIAPAGGKRSEVWKLETNG